MSDRMLRVLSGKITPEEALAESKQSTEKQVKRILNIASYCIRILTITSEIILQNKEYKPRTVTAARNHLKRCLPCRSVVLDKIKELKLSRSKKVALKRQLGLLKR